MKYDVIAYDECGTEVVMASMLGSVEEAHQKMNELCGEYIEHSGFHVERNARCVAEEENRQRWMDDTYDMY